MGTTINAQNLAAVWRERGFRAGVAGLEPAPPNDGEQERAAYYQGHRRGAEKRQTRGATA